MSGRGLCVVGASAGVRGMPVAVAVIVWKSNAGIP